MKLVKIFKMLILHNRTEKRNHTQTNKEIAQRVVSKSCKMLIQRFELASCMWEIESLQTYCEKAPNTVGFEAKKDFLTKLS